MSISRSDINTPRIDMYSDISVDIGLDIDLDVCEGFVNVSVLILFFIYIYIFRSRCRCRKEESDEGGLRIYSKFLLDYDS